MNIRKKLIKLNIFLFMILVTCVAIVTIFDVVQNQTRVTQVEKRELLAIIHEGNSNTCHWTISDAGQLTIGSGTLANYTNTGQAPWYQYRSQIKNVYVNPGVKTNTHCVGLFYGLSNCTTISMANLDTVTNSTSGLTHFFEGCTSLTSLTLPNNFVTSKVTNISHMFKNCKKITTIDVSKFVTTNVTNVDSLFMGCTKLTSITWGTFNTSKVTSFANMFSSCNSLTAIGKAINTASATNMDCMFYDCNLVTSINFSNFNTSNVTSMYKMFSYCGVKSLDLSTFNTSKVTNMQEMLANIADCNSIKLGANFRFKKSNTTLLQVFGPVAYYWKSGSTIKTSLQLENITGTVTGTWVRQCIINYYQGGTYLGQTTINAGSNGTLTAYSGTAPANWTFYGWSTSSTGVTRNYVNSASITNAPVSTTSSYIKLYAVFSRNLIITYNGNGNTGGSTANSTKVIYYNPNNSSTSNQAITLSSNGYTKTGYSFTGWNTASNGSGTNYSAGASYNPGLAYNASSYTKTLYANWSSNTLSYTVNHYVHDIGTNTYTINSTQTFTGTKGSTLTLSNLSIEITGFTYVEGFVNTGNTTKPTSGAVATTTIPSSGSLTINLYYRRNYLYVQYNVNGGTMASEYDASIYGIDNSTIVFNGNEHYNLRGVYGSTVGEIHEDTYIVNTSGLHDYNNPDAINIVRSGYKAVENEEWYILNNQNKTTYDQSITTYNANDMASDSGEDLGQGDVYLVLYVNWTPEEYSVTYDANGGIVNPSSKTVNFDDYYGDLAIPRKTGYSFSGWSRLPSGYKELEYIESTGTQYIDSGYKPNTRTGVDVTYQFTEVRSQERVFGVQGKNDVTSSMNYEFYISNDLTLAYAYKDGSGNWTNLSEAADTDMHRLKFNVEGNYIKIDDTIETLNCLATHGSAYNMKIMATNQDVYSQNQTGGIANIKIFDFSIYEAGVLQKKFIPCKNSNNEAGLYDIVNGVFYGNSGTGTFLEGPEVFVSSSSIVEIPFDHTLYANWIINNYTIEYYQGNNGQNEEEVTLLGSSSHTYNVTANLNAYNGTAPSGWEFAGWSTDGGIASTDVVYTNQQSIINLTDQSDGIVNLYAIFKRTIKLNYGPQNNVTSISKIQYYNPYITTLVSEVLAPVPSLTGLSSYGWSALGYRADTTASTATYAVTTEETNITPAYNVGNTNTTVNLYAVYTRDLTLSYNGNGNTGGATASHTLPQRYNTNGAKTSVTFTTQANGFTKTGYTFSKWANDSASGTQVTAGSNAAAFSPAYNSNATTKTMYAIWNANTYKVEYYQGNNTTTAGATKLGESTHTYDTAQNLSTYATLKTSSGKSEPQSWVFYGWSANNGTTATTRTYTNGQSVNNLTTTNNGVIKIYAIFSRTIKFNSGLNCATTSTATQRYNPYKTTGSITAVSAPAPSMTGLSDTQLGWAPIGYRANKTAANRTYAVTTSATNITPAYNVYDVGTATSTTVNLYAVYSRTVTLYHGLNKAQNSTPIQYMNTSGNAVSQILAPAPSTTGLSDYGWEASGYRADTEAIDVSN